MVRAYRDAHSGGKYSKIAEKYGIGKTTYSSQELIKFDREIRELNERTQGEYTSNSVTTIAYRNFKNFVKDKAEKAGDFYGYIEKVGKVASIMHSLEKGMKTGRLPFSKRRKLDIDNPKDVAEAVRHANKYLLDYSLVSPSVRFLRNTPFGTPFLTYYLKIMPVLLETMNKNPAAFVPYVAIPYLATELVKSTLDLDDDEYDILRKRLPEWIREKGHAYLLPYKEEDGRFNIIDFSTMVPWGAHLEVVKHQYFLFLH